MSYGEPLRRNRALKLLALIAGSFTVLFVCLCLMIWSLMSLPLPQKPLLTMAVWPSADLRGAVPEVWREAKEANSPLPTLLGYARDPQTGEPVPFALVFPSLLDAETYRSATWRLESSADLQVSEQSGMSQVFGPLYKLPWSNQIELTVYVKELLDPDGLADDLPTKVSGPVKDGVWTTDLHDTDTFLSESLTYAGTDGNVMALTKESSDAVSAYSILQGVVWPLPDAGTLSWNDVASGTRLSVGASNGQEAVLALGLTAANGDFGLKYEKLSDDTPYKMLTLPTNATGVNDGVTIPHTSISMIDAKKTLSKGCQGKSVAEFDETSLINICSWLGVCWERPSGLQITVKNGVINVCF